MNSSGVDIKGRIKVRLLLRQIPEGVPLSALHDPFLTLPSPDNLSRWLLGEIISETGQRLRLVLVSIMNDEPLGGISALNTLLVETLWTQEATLMAELGDLSPGIIALDPYTDSSGVPRKQRPLFFCKETKNLFHPVCPWCSTVLTECRNDDLLLQAGLKGFSQGTRRYLWCPECGIKDPNSPAFYVKTLDPLEQNNPRVVDLPGLLGLWTARVNSDTNENGLPCSTCEHARSCYSAGETGLTGAQGKITPLSFFDYYLKITNFFPLSLDTCADLLGGRPIQDVKSQMTLLRNPVAEQELQKAALRLSAYSPHDQGPAQAFSLKLNLWIGAISQVENVWKRNPKPLLSLSPASIRVDCLDADFVPGAAPPLKIRLQMYSRALGAQEGTGETGSLGTIDPVYLPPELGHQEPGTTGQFLVESCGPTGSPDTYLLRGILTLRDLSPGVEGENCEVVITFGPAQGLAGEVVAVFKITSSSGRRLKLVSKPLHLTGQDASVFDLLSTQPGFPVSYKLSPASPVSLDFYSLGMLGARIFLVDRHQDLPQVARTLSSLRKHLFHAAPEERDPLKTVTEAMESQEVLSASHLLWEGGESRDLTGLEDQWKRILAVILKMISFPAGFEGAESMAPHEVLRTFRVELSEMASELKGPREALLFKEAPRDPELAGLLEQLLEDTSWLGEPAPEQAEPLHAPQVEAGPSPTGTEAGESLDETVILGHAPFVPTPQGEKKEELQDLTDEEVDKTVIITPKR